MTPTTERLPKLLRTAESRQWLLRMSPEEMDDAMHFVDLLEWIGSMSLTEAAEWRWRIMACWAETQRSGAGLTSGASPA